MSSSTARTSWSLSALALLGGLEHRFLVFPGPGPALGQVGHHGGQAGAQGPGQGGDGASARSRGVPADLVRQVGHAHAHQGVVQPAWAARGPSSRSRTAPRPPGPWRTRRSPARPAPARTATCPAGAGRTGRPCSSAWNGTRPTISLPVTTRPRSAAMRRAASSTSVGRSHLVVGEVDGELGPLVGVHVPADGLAVGKQPGPVGLLAHHPLAGVGVVEAEQAAQVVAVGLRGSAPPGPRRWGRRSRSCRRGSSPRRTSVPCRCCRRRWSGPGGPPGPSPAVRRRCRWRGPCPGCSG